MGIFTEDEVRAAKSVDLCDLAERLGYHVCRSGNSHTLKEMDSVRIFDRRSWYRFSDGTGGSQIDFLRVFCGMDFIEAVRYLQEFSFFPLSAEAEQFLQTGRNKAAFILPEASSDNLRVKKYLTGTRRISEKTVDQFMNQKLIYEEKVHHNVVFVGTDIDGKARSAFMRGIYEKDGGAFKCDVTGSDKRYGFHMEVPGSDTVRVYESALDLLSFYDATSLGSEHLLALGMTADRALDQYVSDRPYIKRIILSLDNDEPGRNAAEKIEDKYSSKGFIVKNLGSPKGYKDYNEWLVASRGQDLARIRRTPAGKTR